MKTIPDSTAKHIASDGSEPGHLTISLPLRLEILNRLYDYGVKYIFCGHYHRNAGGKYRDISQIVTSAIGCQLGTDKSRYRVVTVEETMISHEYVNLPVQFSRNTEFSFNKFLKL